MTCCIGTAARLSICQPENRPGNRGYSDAASPNPEHQKTWLQIHFKKSPHTALYKYMSFSRGPPGLQAFRKLKWESDQDNLGKPGDLGYDHDHDNMIFKTCRCHQRKCGFSFTKQRWDLIIPGGRFYKKQIGIDHEKIVEFTDRTWQRLYTLEAKKLDKVA